MFDGQAVGAEEGSHCSQHNRARKAGGIKQCSKEGEVFVSENFNWLSRDAFVIFALCGDSQGSRNPL
jgi:hypothetical protein